MTIHWLRTVPGQTEALVPDSLTARALLGDLVCVGLRGGGSEDFSVHVCADCSSTLDVLRSLQAKASCLPWDAVLSARQWSGRGQLRRNWVSEEGNLYVAFLLPAISREWQALLPILLGALFCLSLRDMGFPVLLKWPNDILYHEKKVGGLLLEERDGCVLAGLGLNLEHVPEEQLLRREHAFAAGALDAGGFSPGELWLQLVHRTSVRYKSVLSTSTPLEFSRSLDALLAFLGCRVHIGDGRDSACGVYLGLDAQGRLLLLEQGVVCSQSSGSLRLLE